MRSGLRCLLAVVLIAVVVGAIVFVYFFKGFYSVSAATAGGGVMDWFLGNVSDHSVERHAAGVKVPPLDDPAMFTLGFRHYRQMCAECHGGPDLAPEPLAQGLNPSPPPLVENDLEPNQLFWITKNGVRMTGMPAWGKTHTDQELWAMVAFVHRLPKLSAEEYRKLDKEQPRLADDGGED